MVSIETGYSISGFDLGKINGDIYLRIGKKDEPYEGIGRGQVNIQNLPVLYDRSGAIGNPTSDSERTKITPNSQIILFIFYDFKKNNDLYSILEKTADLLTGFCFASAIKSELQSISD